MTSIMVDNKIKGIKVAKRKATFQDKKGKKQQKAEQPSNNDELESKLPESHSESNLDQGSDKEKDSSFEPEDRLNDLSKDEMIVKKNARSAFSHSTISGFKKDIQTNENQGEHNAEILKSLNLFVSSLEKNASLKCEKPEAIEELFNVSKTLSKELQSSTADFLLILPELKRIQEKVIGLVKANCKLLSPLNKQKQKAKVSIVDDIKENIVDDGMDLNKEYLASEIRSLMTQINAHIHRSVSALNEDPTVLGSINQTEVQDELSNDAQKAFREFYMDCITETYGDELSTLREEEGFDQSRLEMLIDSIESGMTLFPESDRALLTYKAT